MNLEPIECGEKPTVELWSFGFKFGTIEANLVVDARFLPNPYYVPSLCHMTGKDAPCAAHVFKDPGTEAFAASLATLVRAMEHSFGEQGKKSLKIAIGCTGGQHRSVAVVETVAKALREADIDFTIHHRELGKVV
jgi:UPF0042 nucleotide-binding protein